MSYTAMQSLSGALQGLRTPAKGARPGVDDAGADRAPIPAANESAGSGATGNFALSSVMGPDATKRVNDRIDALLTDEDFKQKVRDDDKEAVQAAIFKAAAMSTCHEITDAYDKQIDQCVDMLAGISDMDGQAKYMAALSRYERDQKKLVTLMTSIKRKREKIQKINTLKINPILSDGESDLGETDDEEEKMEQSRLQVWVNKRKDLQAEITAIESQIFETFRQQLGGLKSAGTKEYKLSFHPKGLASMSAREIQSELRKYLMHHVNDLYTVIPTAMRTIDGFNQDTGLYEQPSKAENNYDQIDPAILSTYLMQNKVLYSALGTWAASASSSSS